MKILHISTSDYDGGAAKAAYRLHTGLNKMGVESMMFVKNKKGEDISVIKYKYPTGLGRILFKIQKSRIEGDYRKYKFSKPQGYEIFSDDRSSSNVNFFSQLKEADIYNLHWTSEFVDLPAFFKNVRKPIVWTLHDMFPFTGGCHYNSGCENFHFHCQMCPQLGSKTAKDLSFRIWERKFKAINSHKGEFIVRTDSNWLTREAEKSALFAGLDIRTIHYGIETDEFIPRDKKSCRKALGIPDNCKVIVFGAPGIHNPRKGFMQLNESLGIIRKKIPDIFLLSFGVGSYSTDNGIRGLHAGYITNNNLLSVIYSCADIFVIPSLQEAFGQTALEAMSCGIPVAGFNTGGIPDMIEDGRTGFLAETGNSERLADSIIEILALSENDYRSMSLNCRNKVLSEFTILHQAETYYEDYKK